MTRYAANEVLSEGQRGKQFKGALIRKALQYEWHSIVLVSAASAHLRQGLGQPICPRKKAACPAISANDSASVRRMELSFPRGTETLNDICVWVNVLVEGWGT